MSLLKRNVPVKQYTDYRSYKKQLRLDFKHQCAYCHVREPELGGSKSFHIDHYQPQKSFFEKINDYLNLLYSCRDCNNYKGKYWPNRFQLILECFILNPCLHDFDNHYDYSEIVWIAKSKVATWNILKLNLNSDSRIRIRTNRVNIKKTVRLLEEQKVLALAVIVKLKENEKSNSVQIQEFLQKVIEIDILIATQLNMIEGPRD